MKRTNKKLAAGALLCSLTASAGAMSAQALANDSSGYTKAAKECSGDILKTGLAMVGGGLIIDKLASLLPRKAVNIIGKTGSLLAKPIKWLGSKALDAASNVPAVWLIGGIAIAAYAAYTISEKYFENCVKEETNKNRVKEETKKNEGNSNDNALKVKLVTNEEKNTKTGENK